MKRNLFIIIFTCLLSAGITAGAHQRCDGDWKEKMMAEKIAFLTVEHDLTPEEAQIFWPVYNQINEEKDKATGKVIGSYRAMAAALKEGKNEKEIGKLLEKYLDAQEDQRELDKTIADRYKKVLPVEKVAKLYIGEEKFRRHHIRKLHEKHGEKK